MRTRRTFLPMAPMATLVAAALGAFASLSASDVDASTSIAVTWDGLLRESAAAAVVTPVESRAEWDGGRIYTYTRVHVDRAVSGEVTTTAGDIWVRTMGGVVGDVGQAVEGEATLVPGQSSLVFLHRRVDGAAAGRDPTSSYDVTSRAQGQFPVVSPDPKLPARVVRSVTVGAIVLPRVAVPAAPPQLAADILHNRTVDDAVREITIAWERTHPH